MNHLSATTTWLRAVCYAAATIYTCNATDSAKAQDSEPAPVQEAPPAPAVPANVPPAAVAAAAVDAASPPPAMAQPSPTALIERELDAANELYRRISQSVIDHRVAKDDADTRKRKVEDVTVQLDGFKKSLKAGNPSAELLSASHAGIAHAAKTLSRLNVEQVKSESTAGWLLVDQLLSARCATAICFSNGSKRHWLGIEPLVELPIGIGFAVSSSALGDYVNNHDIRVDLAAGVRLWLFRDVISISIYFGKPLIDSSIRLEGSSFTYSGTAVRRPFPGFALGFLFDSIWIGFDRNELRNGDGKDVSALNPEFPPNEVVSSAWTITLALQPVTAFRTAIGTAVRAHEDAEKKAETLW
jgi:hypothetical protein